MLMCSHNHSKNPGSNRLSYLCKHQKWPSLSISAVRVRMGDESGHEADPSRGGTGQMSKIGVTEFVLAGVAGFGPREWSETGVSRCLRASRGASRGAGSPRGLPWASLASGRARDPWAGRSARQVRMAPGTVAARRCPTGWSPARACSPLWAGTAARSGRGWGWPMARVRPRRTTEPPLSLGRYWPKSRTAPRRSGGRRPR